MVGQNTFFFIQKQKGSYNGGTLVNSLSCSLYGCCASDPYQQGFRLHILLLRPSCLDSTVVQCDSFTLIYVTTDTNKWHSLTSAFAQTVSARVPSLVFSLVALTHSTSEIPCPLWRWGVGSEPILCISHSFLHIARHSGWHALGTP